MKNVDIIFWKPLVNNAILLKIPSRVIARYEAISREYEES